MKIWPADKFEIETTIAHRAVHRIEAQRSIALTRAQYIRVAAPEPLLLSGPTMLTPH